MRAGSRGVEREAGSKRVLAGRAAFLARPFRRAQPLLPWLGQPHSFMHACIHSFIPDLQTPGSAPYRPQLAFLREPRIPPLHYTR